MNSRMGRILLAKMGQGHKEAILNLAKRLGEAGFEVIYTELDQPEAIVNSALQEAVDHIGITTLAGATIDSLKEVVNLLKREGAEHISVTAGGFIDKANIKRIKETGVKAFFPKGTSFDEIIEWSERNIKPVA